MALRERLEAKTMAMTTKLWKTQTKTGWKAICDVLDGGKVMESTNLFAVLEKDLDALALAFKNHVESEKTGPVVPDLNPCGA